MEIFAGKWEQTLSSVIDLLHQQKLPFTQSLNNRGRGEWFEFYSTLYLQYVAAYKNVEELYQILIHPQKRILLKGVLENTMIRMIEVKEIVNKLNALGNDKVKLQFVNFQYKLREMRFTPKYLNIPIPKYFKEEERTRILRRNARIEELMISRQDENIRVISVPFIPSLFQSIFMIQKIERARQAMERVKKIKANKNIRVRKASQNEIIDMSVYQTLKLQKLIRGFFARKKLFEMRQSENILIKIQSSPIPKQKISKAQRFREDIKFMQKEAEIKFSMDKSLLLKELRKIQLPDIKAKLLQQKRQLISKYIIKNKFTCIPSNPEQLTAKPIPLTKKLRSKSTSSLPKIPPSKSLSKPTIKNILKTQMSSISPTKSIASLQTQVSEINQAWRLPTTNHYLFGEVSREGIKKQVRQNVKPDVEKIVDRMIKLELASLRVKLGIVNVVKMEKVKKKKVKKPKVKVYVPRSVFHKSQDELLKLLVNHNLIERNNRIVLEDFKGGYNLMDYQQKAYNNLHPCIPSYGQIKQFVVQKIAIPLGSQIAKDRLDKKQWNLFFGPSGTGKSLIVKALHNQCNTLLIDLSYDKIANQGLTNQQYNKLMGAVVVIAKRMQPSIIVINQAEKFLIPKSRAYIYGISKKYRKFIQNVRKNRFWTANDRISVIACTSKPYLCSQKLVKLIFDNHLHFPLPNYACRSELLKHFFETKIPFGEMTLVPLGMIAGMTEGYTAGSLWETINEIFTEERVENMKMQAFKIQEFIRVLGSKGYVYKQEYRKTLRFIRKLYKKEKEGRRRRRMKTVK